MTKQPDNHAKRQRKFWEHRRTFWHWGKSEDFADYAQEMQWIGVVRDLEDGKASVIIDFLLRQNGRPILPGLRRIIRRLTSGWPFAREDGYPLRLDPLAPHRAKGGLPPFGAPDPLRADLIYHAGSYAHDLIAQGVAKTTAYEKTIQHFKRQNFKLTVDEVRESSRLCKLRMSME
jgi:hypothetical protein